MSFFARKQKLSEHVQDISLTAQQRNMFTPDIALLEQHNFHLLFVFDRMLPGFDEFSKLLEEHSVRAATGFTNEQFVMYKSMLGLHTYPLIQRKDYIRDPIARIKGELYYVAQQQFRELDKVRKNTVEFNRELIDILVPFSRVRKLPSWKEGGRSTVEYQEIYGSPHPSVTEQHMKTIKAFAYIANDDYWNDYITDSQFTTVTYYEARNQNVGLYQSFTKRELFDE